MVMTLTEKIQALVEKNALDEAKNILEEELIKDSTNSRALTLFALLCIQQGDLEKATEHVTLAFNLEKKSSTGVEGLTYQVLADIHKLRGENHEAFYAYFHALVQDTYSDELMMQIKSIHDRDPQNTMVEFLSIKGVRAYLSEGHGKLIDVQLGSGPTGLESCYVAELDNIHALGQSSSVFSADMVYLADDQDYSETDRSDIVATTHVRNVLGFKKAQESGEQDKVLVAIPNSSLYLEACIILNGRASDNYFHWLLEVVPKWLLIESLVEYENMPVLVNGHMPKQHYDILDILLGENRQVIKAEAKVRYTVGKAVIPSKLSRVCFNPMPNVVLSENDALYHPAAITFLRDRFRKRNTTVPTRKIYLSRRSSQLQKRKMLNQEDVEHYLSEKGFEIIDTAELDFSQQVELFSSTKIVIGPTGASFTNIIFCQPTCAVILVAQPENNIGVYFRNLVQSCGITNYVEISAHGVENGFEVGIHQDYHVLLEDITSAINQVENI